MTCSQIVEHNNRDQKGVQVQSSQGSMLRCIALTRMWNRYVVDTLLSWTMLTNAWQIRRTVKWTIKSLSFSKSRVHDFECHQQGSKKRSIWGRGKKQTANNWIRRPFKPWSESEYQFHLLSLKALRTRVLASRRGFSIARASQSLCWHLMLIVNLSNLLHHLFTK